MTDYLTLASTKPKAQDKITSVGFPGSTDRVTDVQRQPPSFASGSVASLSTTKKGVPVIQVNVAVSNGMSGGPTLNDAGQVIGINSFGAVGENQDFNFVTDTDVMKKFFEAQGVKSEVVNPTPTALGGTSDLDSLPTASSSSSFPWVLVAGTSWSSCSSAVGCSSSFSRTRRRPRRVCHRRVPTLSGKSSSASRPSARHGKRSRLRQSPPQYPPSSSPTQPLQ